MTPGVRTGRYGCCAAHVLKGTVNVDWRTFARTAKALLNGRAVETIPIMEYIWRGRIGIW